MISFSVGIFLVLLAIAIRISSIRRSGFFSNEIIYFILCIVVAAFFMHQDLQFSSISFAEENQVLGLEREPSTFVQLSSWYRMWVSDLALWFWIVFLALCELCAHFFAPLGGRASIQHLSQPTGKLIPFKTLLMYLKWLIGPACILYLFLAILLGNEKYNGRHVHGYLAVIVATPLLPILTAYSWPSYMLTPYWAASPGRPSDYYNDGVYFGGDPCGRNIYPRNILQFFIALIPWLLVALFLTLIDKPMRKFLNFCFKNKD